VWDRALDYSRERIRPGRTEEVIADLAEHVDWGPADNAWQGVLADPQTSGGLLMAVDPSLADELLTRLRACGEPASLVGRMTDGHPGHLTIID
jgi:selenide,water dikinase